MKNVISILVIIIVGLFVITTQISPEYYDKDFWRYPQSTLYKFKQWPDYIRCMNQAQSFENSATTREEFNKYFAPASGMSVQSGRGGRYMLKGCVFGTRAVEVNAAFTLTGRQPAYAKACSAPQDCWMEDVGGQRGRPDDRLGSISKPVLAEQSKD